MQITYLKDAPTAQAGDTQDVPDDQARVLIILGYAKDGLDSGNNSETPKTKRPKKSDTDNA